MNKILQIAGIVLLLLTMAFSAEAKLNIFPQPRYIPPLNFYGSDGKTYQLADFKADLLLAIIWSRSCGPCISELKNLNAFAKKMKHRGIEVILVSPEKEWKTADERRLFMNKVGAPDLATFLDRKGAFINGMGIRVTPTTILVNRNNEEVGQITGVVRWDDSDVERYMIKLRKKVLEQLNDSKTADKQN